MIWIGRVRLDSLRVEAPAGVPVERGWAGGEWCQESGVRQIVFWLSRRFF